MVSELFSCVQSAGEPSSMGSLMTRQLWGLLDNEGPCLRTLLAVADLSSLLFR